MFTGIIEEVGTIRKIAEGSDYGSLMIAAKDILPGTKLGDSIAVNGVCLTATKLMQDAFTADVMAETMRRTNLGSLSAGSPVNLERAMPADGRFGGHIVSGHIDGTGEITDLRREGNAVWVTVEANAEILALIVEKGSITIDGISLTVAETDEHIFRVSIIPHTGAQTTLLGRKVGDRVNLETDIVGKYVQKLLRPKEVPPNREALTMDFLIEHGF
ncbi:MAG: riboflavin synthase [Evtepia sp.]